MKIKIWTFAYDANHVGTGCEVFTSQAKLRGRLLEIMKPAEIDEAQPRKVIRDLIDQGDVDLAWEYWEDNCRDPMDTYSIDEHDIEATLPPGEFLACTDTGLSPSGPKGRKVLPLLRQEDGIFVPNLQEGNDPGEGALMDWWNDRLQIVVMDRQEDEPALHVRYNSDGGIVEIMVREDLVDMVKIASGPTTAWQRERDDDSKEAV
jgi:hypothetical protein